MEREQKRINEFDKQIKRIEIEKQQEMKKVGLTEDNINSMGENNLPKQIKKIVDSLKEKIQQRDKSLRQFEKSSELWKTDEEYSKNSNFISRNC